MAKHVYFTLTSYLATVSFSNLATVLVYFFNHKCMYIHTHAQKFLHEFVMARAQDSLLFHRFTNPGVIILYSLMHAITNTHLKGACMLAF